jgi:hypothetical protein
MAGLIKNPVDDVGTSSLNTSPGINKKHARTQNKMKKATHVFMRGWLCDVSLFYVDQVDCSGFDLKTKQNIGFLQFEANRRRPASLTSLPTPLAAHGKSGWAWHHW